MLVQRARPRQAGRAQAHRRGDLPGRQGLPGHAAAHPALAARPLLRRWPRRSAPRWRESVMAAQSALKTDTERARAAHQGPQGRDRPGRRDGRARAQADRRGDGAGRGPGRTASRRHDARSRPLGVRGADAAAPHDRHLPRQPAGRRLAASTTSPGSTSRCAWRSPGKVKAGKSTLLNALVGEQIAPTDAGECTRIVTWYRDAPVPRVRCTRVGAAAAADDRAEPRRADVRPAGHARRAGRQARRAVAVAEPARPDPDRHPGHRARCRGTRRPGRARSSPRTTRRARPTPSST